MTAHRVLYLAFGPYRVRAALAHTRDLAERGARVTLLVTDRPEWRDLDGLDPRVSVQRFPAEGGPVTQWRGARQAVNAWLAIDDPDLVVAGDAHAVPAAYDVRRRRPTMRVAFEPGEPRPLGAAGLAVVTPWYPSPNNPFAGAFAQAATAAVADRFAGVSVLHTEDWTGPASGLASDLVRTAAVRLRVPPPVLDTAEGTLLRVPVPVVPKRGYAEWARAHEEALAEALPGGRIEADVVHGHVGIYGGWLATRLARPGARVVVTEHATFLRRILRQAPARAMYGEVLDRADRMICVSETLRAELLGYFPRHADKVEVIPNAVDFDRIPALAEPAPTLDRWLYVGRLIGQKNVETLLEAFARAARQNPRATLTLVGSGELAPTLRARAAALGLSERVTLTGPLPPAEVTARLHAADLLVHASRLETFGVTVVEAVAAGLPVLATRSGGPEETLAGLEGVAGHLVDVSDDPAVLLDGYHRLRDAFADLDLPRARAELESRYGSAAVAEKLMAAYQGGEARPQPRPQPRQAEQQPAADAQPQPLRTVVVGAKDAPAHVVLLALNHPTPRRVIHYAHWLIARGVNVTLVTVQGDHWRALGLDPRVDLRTLREAEGRHPLPRGERVLVHRAPRALLRRAKERADARPVELALGALERGHQRAADAFHRKVFLRGYRVLRPYLLAQVAEPALRGIDFATVDLVVAADSNGITLGWQLARRHPQLAATTAMDRDRFAGREVTDPAIDPERQPERPAGDSARDAALVAVGTAGPALEG